MNKKDIRWIQRLNHFEKAMAQLTEAITLARQRELSKLERQGLIQAFEFTHELAWNTMKDFLEERGHQPIYGSRDASRAFVKAGLLEHGEIWMEMIQSRNQTTHTYNESTADEIAKAIIGSYHDSFGAFQVKLSELRESEE